MLKIVLSFFLSVYSLSGFCNQLTGQFELSSDNLVQYLNAVDSSGFPSESLSSICLKIQGSQNESLVESATNSLKSIAPSEMNISCLGKLGADAIGCAYISSDSTQLGLFQPMKHFLVVVCN